MQFHLEYEINGQDLIVKTSFGAREIREIIEMAWHSYGQVSLRNADDEIIGIEFVESRFDNGKCIFSILYFDGNNLISRDYLNNDNTGRVEIMGDMWDKSLVCYDMHYIIDLFEEIYFRGDLSDRKYIV